MGIPSQKNIILISSDPHYGLKSSYSPNSILGAPPPTLHVLEAAKGSHSENIKDT